jgi:hypothetical protein
MFPTARYTVAILLFVVSALWVAQPVYAASEGGEVVGAPAWTSTMGGALQDDGYDLVVDGDGNTIVVGEFRGSADFDPGAGTYILNSVGSADAFIAKLDPSGALVWAVSFGGTRTTTANGVAVDANGDVYVIGNFDGETDFDPGAGQQLVESHGSTDIFLLRLDGDGNLVRAVTLGGDSSDDGEAVYVDWRGHIYITGSFEDSMEVGIDPNGGNIILESEGDDDAFVIRYSNAGDLLRAWTMGGDNDDVGRDIYVDDAGNVYVAGDFEGKIDLDPDLDDIRRSKGHEDIFVAKYDDTADQKWGATFGGLDEDVRPSISVDPAGNVYVTGNFESTADFDPTSGVYELTSHGEDDIFVARLNSSGALVWANAIGGLGSDRGEGIAAGYYGDLFVTGSFHESVDFDPGTGEAILNSAGQKDAFIGRYGTNGMFLAVQAISGPQQDVGSAIDLDKTDGLYVAGSFQGTADFNVGASAVLRTSAGDSDVFTVKRTYSTTPFGPVASYLPSVNRR